MFTILDEWFSAVFTFGFDFFSVFCYVSVAGRKIYAMLDMAYLITLLLTGSALYNVFMWTTVFLFFGSINYLKTVDYSEKRLRKKIKIRIR